MITAEYGTNRARFPRLELEQYRGSWVAFSDDGRRIVASGETIQRLEEQLAAAGQDPQQVVFERIPGPPCDSDCGIAASMPSGRAARISHFGDRRIRRRERRGRLAGHCTISSG